MSKHYQDSEEKGRAPGLAPEKSGDPTYAVGYGHPPLETRFAPGKSGNPKGRRKTVRVRNLKAELQRVYSGVIAVRDGNKTLHISRLVVLVHKLVNEGIKGNLRAAQAALKIAMACDIFEVKDALDVSQLTDEELETVATILKKTVKKDPRFE